jgi:hypothetical protein
MKTKRDGEARRERLRVRLTADEASVVADLAAARGLTVSDLVRRTLLRGHGSSVRVGRRSMQASSAEVIRELHAIGTELRRLSETGPPDETTSRVELAECLARVQAAIVGLGP